MKNATSDDKMIKLTKKEDIEAKEKLEVWFWNLNWLGWAKKA